MNITLKAAFLFDAKMIFSLCCRILQVLWFRGFVQFPVPSPADDGSSGKLVAFIRFEHRKNVHARIVNLNVSSSKDPQ